MSTRHIVLRLAGITAGALVIGLVVFLVVQGSMLPEDPAAVPEPETARLTLLLFADLLVGLVAVAALPIALLPSRDLRDARDPDGSPDPRPDRSIPTAVPLAAGLAVAAATAISSLAVPAALIVLVSFATRRPRWWFAVAGVMLAVAGWVNGVVLAIGGGVSLWFVLVGVAVLLAVTALIGAVRRSRRELLRSLREEAASARREQEARLAAERAAERTRIAREMHDTLSHRLSLISMYSGALDYRPDLDPGTVRQTARLLQETSRTASQELREVLTVLRSDPEETAPGATLADLPGLIGAACEAGSVVTADLAAAPDPEALPVALSRAVFRICQETLTNARKHAPGAPVHLTVAGDPDVGVTVTATNPLPDDHGAKAGAAPEPVPGGTGAAGAPGTSGFGLIGLEERVRLRRGTLHVDRGPRAFTVTAWMPWQS